MGLCQELFFLAFQVDPIDLDPVLDVCAVGEVVDKRFFKRLYNIGIVYVDADLVCILVLNGQFGHHFLNQVSLFSSQVVELLAEHFHFNNIPVRYERF